MSDAELRGQLNMNVNLCCSTVTLAPQSETQGYFMSVLEAYCKLSLVVVFDCFLYI